MRLVKYRREGRLVYYSLDDDHVHTLLRQGLEHVDDRDPRAGAAVRSAGDRPNLRRLGFDSRAGIVDCGERRLKRPQISPRPLGPDRR